jgi:hypothetical protein
MKFKASVLVVVLAGIGLAGCSNLSRERSSGTESYSQPQPLQNSSSSGAGQSASGIGTETAQKQESAFRQLDTNHDGVIDRQEFNALKLM